MGISLRTNLSSMKAARQVTQSKSDHTNSLHKLTTGQRINSSADDAGGQSVAATMRADNVSLKQAIRNSNDGIPMIQTAEGSLESITSILTRLREVAIQAGNDTYTTADRLSMDEEYTELLTEFARTVSIARFNHIDLLNATGSITLQVGILGNTDHQIDIDLSNINASLGSLGITARIQSLNTGGGAYDRTAIDAFDAALTKLNTRRSYLGSLQRRLENTLDNAFKQSEDLSASQSKIMDTDYAYESSESTRSQIMVQSGVAAMGQAKSLPQNVISLLS